MYYNKEERKQEIKAAVRKELRNIIPVLIFIALIVAAAFIVIHLTDKEEEPELIRINAYEGDKDIIKMENSDLLFELDPSTTYFTVTNKKTGVQWKSNPDNASSDPKALPAERDRVLSTLILTYSNKTSADTKYNNYEYCISRKLFDIEADADHIKVKYSIGQVQREFIIPTLCTEERFDELTGKMDPNNAKGVRSYYKKYDINNLSKTDQANKDELLQKYPIMADQIVYVLRDGVKDNLKTKFEIWFEEAGYTTEEYIYDKENYQGESSSDKPVFNISMVYSLDGNCLKVEVPFEEIEHKRDFPLISLQVLPYFGAGSWEEEGALLIPEGGGSLIYFNNGKVDQSAYYANVYGWDYAMARKALVHETRVSYGVFGIKRATDSFICCLGEGAGYASINADIAGKLNGFNNVFAEYTTLHREEVDVAARMNGKMYLYEQGMPQETMELNYLFVGSGDIVDMAKTYEGYLSETLGDSFTEMQDDKDVPVVVDVLCAVDKVEQVLGVPASRPLALTTYSEAEEMIKDIKGNGISNLSVKLSGWMNDGINQEMLTKVKLIGKLGNKKDFNSLANYTKTQGIPLYLDAVTQYEYNTNVFEGFFVYTDAACYANKKRAELSSFSTIYFGPDEDADTYYLLKPALILKMMRNIKDYTVKNNAYGVSFRDIGYQLSSDFKRKSRVTRQEAMEMQIAELESYAKSGLGIMTNVGNDYVYGVSDLITNMDLGGFDYTIIDEEVPFLYIALHGHTNYTGEALNITSNCTEELLKSVECGAGLSFIFMDEDAQTLQDTLYSKYFGTSYGSWKDKFKEICDRYSKELGHTFDQGIKDWKRLSSAVTVTTYDDGTKVYVNFSYSDFTTANGLVVPARDYVVER